MKMFLPISALAVFVVGLLLGAQMHRYEYVKSPNDWYAARFDRWHGKVEITTYGFTEEAKSQLHPKPSPTPPHIDFDPDAYLRGTPTPRPR